MADAPGSLLDLTPLASPPAPAPRSAGRAIPGARRVDPVEALSLADFVGVEFTSAGPGPSAPSPANHNGAVHDPTPGVSWFERVHLLPREKIDFGNLITTVQDSFELFNAFTTPSTLTTFVNNAGAGVTVPDLPGLPHVMAPFTSILDPTSTRLNPVELIVQAEEEGPASFDDTLDFTFAPGGTLLLGVTGNRIIFIPFDYDRDYIEIMDFGGSVLTSLVGGEQRIDEREGYRQSFDVRYDLNGREKRQMRALLFEWQGRLFAFPIKKDRMFITAAVSAGVTVLVDDTTEVDLRDGGLAVVFKDNEVNDVLQVVSRTPTSIVFASAVQNSYDIGDVVMPIRTVFGKRTVSGNRTPVEIETFQMSFKVTDNTTGAPAGDTSPFSSYLGLVLLDDCNVMDSQVSISRETRVTILDADIGGIFQEPAWDRGKRSYPKIFRVQTRLQELQVRKLLIALRGRQVSFYIPTFDDELIVTQDLGTASDKMVVENIGYTKFIESRLADLRITFTDGTSLERVVQSSVVLSVAEEELTLDTTWGVNKTVAEVQRVEYYERVRLQPRQVRIQHQGMGKARVFMPLVEVFD